MVDDVPVDEERLSAAGTFRSEDLAPGPYSLLAEPADTVEVIVR